MPTVRRTEHGPYPLKHTQNRTVCRHSRGKWWISDRCTASLLNLCSFTTDKSPAKGLLAPQWHPVSAIHDYKHIHRVPSISPCRKIDMDCWACVRIVQTPLQRCVCPATPLRLQTTLSMRLSWVRLDCISLDWVCRMSAKNILLPRSPCSHATSPTSPTLLFTSGGFQGLLHHRGLGVSLG